MKKRMAVAVVGTMLVNLLTPGVWGQGEYEGKIYAAAAEASAVVQSYSPANKSQGVSLTPGLSLTFDRAVEKTGTDAAKGFTIKRQNDNQTVLNVPMSKTEISSDGLRVTLLTGSLPLDANTSYYVLADSGTLSPVLTGAETTDGVTAKAWAGISSALVWSFKTGAAADITPPTLVSSSPINASVGIKPDAPLGLSFSEAVAAAEGSIIIYEADTMTKDSAGAMKLSVLSDEVTGLGTSSVKITPKAASGHVLKAGTRYGVHVDAGVFADLGGLPYNTAIDWTFTTETLNNVPPTVAAFSPQAGLAGASTTGALKITFSEKVAPKAGTLYIYELNTSKQVAALPVTNAVMDASGTTASLNYSGLSRSTPYYVLIDAGSFLDVDGTAFAGIQAARTWTFTTTGDALSLSGLTPASGTTGVAAGSPLQLTFSRVVYPNTGGTVTITRNDGLVDSFAINSAQVVGGGTNTLTVTPKTPLAVGYTYTVTLSSGALADSEGNNFPTTSSALNWSFSTIVDTSLIQVASLTPADRSTGVATDSEIRVRFNRSVSISDAAGITLNRSGGSKVTAAAKVSPTNNRDIVITPAAALSGDTAYYVDIANGAVVDLSNPGIRFSGLSGSALWSFRTAAIDKSVPTIQSAVMNGTTTIRLTYNKLLNTTYTPLITSYKVTVNGDVRVPSSASISGDSVYLTLDTGVAVGQDVKVTYDPGTRPVQDASGNQAAALAAYAVTNGLDTALPKPREGTVYTNSVTLVFPNGLQGVNPTSNGANQFKVTADGNPITVSSYSTGGPVLYLTLASAVPSGAAVKVNYDSGTNLLRDASNQIVAGFTDFSVRNLLDSRPPQFVSASLGDKTLTMTYDEPLATNNLPANSQFSVLSYGAPVYVTGVKVDGEKVILSLASALIADGNVNLSYVPGALRLTDLNGNAAPTLNLVPVGAASGASGISSATVQNTQLQVTFTTALSALTDSGYAQFIVLANGASVPVTAAAASGSTLTLTLGTSVPAGQTVQLSYAPSPSGKDAIKSASGSAIPSFTKIAVKNLGGTVTPTTPGTPAGDSGILAQEVFGKKMLILDPKNAASTTDLSAYNSATHLYKIDGGALKTALTQAAAQADLNGAVVFQVPDTDASAKVSVPVAVLQTAYTSSPKGSFAVRYKDMMFELPLKEAAAMNKGITDQTGLVIQLEAVPDSAASRLRVQAGNSGASPITSSLADYRFKLTDTSFFAGDADATVKGIYRLKYNLTTPVSRTAVVTFPSNAERPSFVPTYVLEQDKGMVLSGTMDHSQILLPVTSTLSFQDVENHWAKDTINELAAKYILDANTSTVFQPNQSITRMEFANMLYRGLGLAGDTAAAMQFSDLTRSGKNVDGVGAAVKAGIITGYTDGTFRPDNPITREEMAIMMVRALHAAGADITLSSSANQVLSPFKDRTKIKYTDEAAKAVQAGIIQGGSGGRFNPQGSATRAEAAVMLKRVLQKAGYLN
ncbi:hypothetical protein B9G55_09985 [Saccharibacillus sp. O16]|nr:hypothetical protein B9G55_09985 [Saccharibacillus sp. O16]